MNTSSYAKEEQSAAMEQDDREGLVMTYLDMGPAPPSCPDT